MIFSHSAQSIKALIRHLIMIELSSAQRSRTWL